MKLEDISRGFMLRAAIENMSHHRRRAVPLWSLVRNLCGVGSGSAHAICRELGWNPDAAGTDEIPPEKPPVQETWAKEIPKLEGVYDFRSDETTGGVSLIKIYRQGDELWVEDADIGNNTLARYHGNLSNPEYRFREKL